MLNWFWDNWNFIHAVWHGLSKEVKAAIISGSATVLAAIAGFSAIVFQMRSQGRQSRATIGETERRKLKAGLYEEAVVASRAVSNAAINLSTKLRLMLVQLEATSGEKFLNPSPHAPSARFDTLLEAHSTFSDAVTRLIFLIETRKIINPNLTIFRTAFSAVSYDIMDMMFSKFVAHVAPALPANEASYSLPTASQIQIIGNLVRQSIGFLDDATAYSEDFLVEMQNLLLGDLFRTQLEHRKPPDPNSKVIRLDNAKELQTWFLNETLWGRNIKRTEAEALLRFNNG